MFKIPHIGYVAGQGFTLLLAYFLPIRPLIHAVVFLFLVDWIFGIWKSRKAHRRLTSYRFRKSVTKITGYIVCVMSTYVFQNIFLPDWANLTHIAAGYIAFTELVSIYENISEITGKRLLLELKEILVKNLKETFKSK